MTEEFTSIEEIEEIKDAEESKSAVKRGCFTTMAVLMALVLLFSAAVPLTQFLIRRSYQRQVEVFPSDVCENILNAGLTNQFCDASPELLEFITKTFPIGASVGFVESAMKGFSLHEQTGSNQPGCRQPDLWTFTVAKSVLGWKTEIQFLFCSDLLVERIVLVNGSPVSLPTYDL